MEIVLLAPQPEAEPYVIGEMKQYNHSGRNACVSQMIRMMADLQANGMDSSFIKHLGRKVYELKPHTRGGHKGGARVYFFISQNIAVLCACECKQPDEQADQEKLGFTQWNAQHWQPLKENPNETTEP